jgi:hypothetical protein
MVGKLVNNGSEKIWKEEVTELVCVPAKPRVHIQVTISLNLGQETGYSV